MSRHLSTLSASPLATCNDTNSPGVPGAVYCEGVSLLAFHLHGSNSEILVPEPRGVCSHHTFKQAPLALMSSAWNSEQQTYLCVFFCT